MAARFPLTMNIQDELRAIGLDTENSVVIGSGILSALGLRPSADVDVTVDEKDYDRLSNDSRFAKSETHSREILIANSVELGTTWGVLGKVQTFADLIQTSVVINNVRYVSLEFLLKVKESWLHDEDVRQKDIDDVKLIKDYLAK